MPRRFLLLLGFVAILAFQKTEAQNVVFDTVGNTILTADTIAKVERKGKSKKAKKAKKPHSPTKATIMSACLPGLGQIYNGKWWKVPIVYAGLGGLGYLAYNNYYEYRSYLHAYEYKTGDLPDDVTLNQHEIDLTARDANYLQTYKESYRRDFEFYTILTVAWYGLNIVDACVDGHLYTYDISDDLSLTVDPYLHRQTESPIKIPQYAQVGLSFKLNLK